MSSPHLWPRLYVPDALAPGVRVPLTPEADHYLRRVLRREPGDDVRLFNGRDGEVHARLTDSAPSHVARGGKRAGTSVSLDVIATLCPQGPSPRPEIWLYAAPLKKAHVDFLVMKATELGVIHLQPVLTQRTQVRVFSESHAGSIAREAAEQADRLDVPVVHALRPLSDILASWPAERLPFVCAEAGPARPLREALAPFAAASAPASLPPSIAFFTGPEGGLTDDERRDLAALPSAIPIRLGPRILRADTAALVALACWQMICGEGRDLERTVKTC